MFAIMWAMGDRGQKADQTRKQAEDGVTVYNRVRLLRQERGLSQKELASVLGINHRTVGYLERQDYEPSISLAWKIAWFFEVPVDEVFSHKPFKSLSEHFQNQ